MMTFPEDLSIIKFGGTYRIAFADIGEHTLNQLQEEFFKRVAHRDEKKASWSAFVLWMANKYEDYSIKVYDCLEYFEFDGKDDSHPE